MLQPEVMLSMQAFMLGSTCFVGWAACLMMAAHSALDSFELRQDSGRLIDEGQRAERVRRDIIAR